MKFTITGSLGHIGKPLASHLIKEGHTVTVISNNPERIKEIEASRAIPAIGSVDNAGFLTSVFKGCDAVFLMVPPNMSAPDPRKHYQSVGRSYADAVKHSGVKRVVHLSSWGAHLPEGTGFITGSHDIEVMLNELASAQDGSAGDDVISVTNLRAGFFYYNLLGFIPMIRQAGFIGSVYGGDDKIVMADPADIADAAAEELVKQAGERVRYVASADLTASSVASVLGNAIGKPDLQWLTLSEEQALKGLLQAGMPENIARLYVELGASIHSAAMREDYDLHPPAKMGRVSIADYAPQFAGVYNKG